MPRVTVFRAVFLALAASAAVAAPASAAVDFSTSNLNTGPGPNSLVADYFHNFTALDLGVTNSGNNTISLLLGNGTGGFANTAGSPFAGIASEVATDSGDFNNDGNVDLLVAGGDTVNVYLGNGSGGFFATRTLSIAPGTASSVAVGFFDSGNNLDFAVSTSGAGAQSVKTYFGLGDGTFVAGGTLAIGTGTTHVVASSFNTQGRVDLAATSATSQDLRVFLNNGSGAFNPTAASPISLPGSPQDLTTGDLNNDGREDIAVANQSNNAIDVLLATGTGTFLGANAVPAGPSPSAVVIDDFDADGNFDLAATNQTSPGGSVALELGTGNGSTFLDGGALATRDAAPDALVSGDFNNDGNPDIAATNSGGGTVALFLADAPSVNLSTGSLGFGNQVVNSASSSQSVTFKNNGKPSVNIGIDITGGQRDDFSITSNNCQNGPLASGSSCSVGVNFKPRSNGNKSATLTFFDNASGGGQQTVGLSGTGVPNRPSSNAAPVITGSAIRGDILTCSNGTWTNSPTSFAHQWLRNGVAIPGATGATYVLTQADVGTAVACQVTASNAGGSASRTSASFFPIAPAPLLAVSIPRQTLTGALRSGVTFTATCSAACNLSGRLIGPAPPKRKSKARRTATITIGTVRSTALAGGTPKRFTVRISSAGRRALRGKTRATLGLALTATDPSGSPSTAVNRSVALRNPAKKRK